MTVEEHATKNQDPILKYFPCHRHCPCGQAQTSAVQVQARRRLLVHLMETVHSGSEMLQFLMVCQSVLIRLVQLDYCPSLNAL